MDNTLFDNNILCFSLVLTWADWMVMQETPIHNNDSAVNCWSSQTHVSFLTISPHILIAVGFCIIRPLEMWCYSISWQLCPVVVIETTFLICFAQSDFDLLKVLNRITDQIKDRSCLYRPAIHIWKRAKQKIISSLECSSTVILNCWLIFILTILTNLNYCVYDLPIIF